MSTPPTFFSTTSPFNQGIGSGWLTDDKRGWRSLLKGGFSEAVSELGEDYMQRIRDLAGYTYTGTDGNQYFIGGTPAPVQDGSGEGASTNLVNVYNLLGKGNLVSPGEQLWGVTLYNPNADDITDYNGYIRDAYDNDGNFLSAGTMQQSGDAGFWKNFLSTVMMVAGAGVAGGGLSGFGIGGGAPSTLGGLGRIGLTAGKNLYGQSQLDIDPYIINGSNPINARGDSITPQPQRGPMLPQAMTPPQSSMMPRAPISPINQPQANRMPNQMASPGNPAPQMPMGSSPPPQTTPSDTGVPPNPFLSDGSFNWDSLLQLIMGNVDNNAQNNAADGILEYIRGGHDYITNMYKPDSPEYNALWDQMSRRDAAAGRNSQYGPRSVDLASNITRIKGDLLSDYIPGTALALSNAYRMDAGSHSGLGAFLGSGGLSSLMNLLGGGSSSLLNLLRNIGGGNTDWSGTDGSGDGGWDPTLPDVDPTWDPDNTWTDGDWSGFDWSDVGLDLDYSDWGDFVDGIWDQGW